MVSSRQRILISTSCYGLICQVTLALLPGGDGAPPNLFALTVRSNRISKIMSSHPLSFAQSWSRRVAGAAAVLLTATTAATVIPPQPSHATGPGLTLFGEQSLNFNLDSGANSTFDRYRLRIPPQETAISQVVVGYDPTRWRGRLDEDNIELRYRKDRDGRERVFKLRELAVDTESGIVSLVPEQPVPAGERVEVVFHNVANPRNGGFFKFRCNIAIPGDRAQQFRFLGNWVIDIE